MTVIVFKMEDTKADKPEKNNTLQYAFGNADGVLLRIGGKQLQSKTGFNAACAFSAFFDLILLVS